MIFCLDERVMPSSIMGGVNQESIRHEFTIQTPTQTQVSGFAKNGKIDIRQSYNEVCPHAYALGCDNFNCSVEQN